MLQNSSFQTLVLILHHNAALFLPNKFRNELSDFFYTLNCGDKNSIIEITTYLPVDLRVYQFCQNPTKKETVISFLRAD